MAQQGEWYYQIMGQTFGPVAAEQFKSLAADGTIDRDTLVRKGEGGNWATADHVRGLFKSDEPDRDSSNTIASVADAEIVDERQAMIVPPPIPTAIPPKTSTATVPIVLLLSPCLLGIFYFVFSIVFGTIQDVLENGFGGGASPYSWAWISPVSFLSSIAFLGGLLCFGLLRNKRAADDYEKRRRADQLAYAKAREATLKWIRATEPLLRRDPTNSDLHSNVIRLSESWPDLAYEVALHTVEVSGGASSTKQLALLTGRRYHSTLRPDGNPATSGEHAIQNDIDSRVMASHKQSPIEPPETGLSDGNILDLLDGKEVALPPSLAESKLIPCPDCGVRISRRATSCPQCGCPMGPLADG